MSVSSSVFGEATSLVLPPGEIHLWWAATSAFPHLPALSALLDEEEQRRADRFKVERPRQAFVLGRGLLRLLLGRYTDRPARQLSFTYSDRGKPSLATERSLEQTPPAFNLSHSGDLVVLAFTSGDEVGVDVERLRQMPNALELAKRFFSPAEYARLQSLPAADRSEAFLRSWTCKEAYLKAVGSGIGEGLRGVETVIDPPSPPLLVRVTGDGRRAADWKLLTAEPCPGYVAAVVIRQGSWQLLSRPV